MPILNICHKYNHVFEDDFHSYITMYYIKSILACNTHANFHMIPISKTL